MDISMLDSAKQFLLDKNFISNKEEKCTFSISPLGLATQRLNLFPECALIMFENLKRIEGLDDPHIMYTVYLVRITIILNYVYCVCSKKHYS